MKEMVICSDLHENSDDNIKTGVLFAKTLGLKPTIYHIDTIAPQLNKQFHAATIKPHYVEDPVWKKNIEVTVLDMVNEALKRVDIKKEEVDFENFEGSITEGVDHLREHKNMEILSIGATHHGSIHRFFLNTFAEKSFFHLRKDVLVTKKRVDKYSHITYLIPYAPLDEDDLSKVIYLAKCHSAKVHMDCIVPINFVGYSLELFEDSPYPREVLTNEMSQMHQKAEAELKKAQEKLRKESIESSYSLKMILNEDAGKHLEELVRDEGSDLVILKPQNYTFEHLSVGSVSLDIMRTVSCNLFLLQVSD